MGGREAFERLPRLPALGAFGRDLDEPAPDLRGTLEILLAERAHDAHVQQRLGVLRIDLQRMLELLDGEVGLVVVVVAHAQVGAHARIFRVERERLGVPLDGVGKTPGVVVQISELRARDGVLRIAIDDVAQRLHL